MQPADGEEDHAFQAILQQIKRVKGLDFTLYRPSCLKRRIDTRLRAHNLPSYTEYLAFLKHYPAEYEQLLDAATINVSEFFRDQTPWITLQKEILPAIIQAKTDKNLRTIRVWSAGCSGGEEAYTLAILFQEILGAKLKDFNIKIYATDIDKDSLQRARRAQYELRSLQNIPALKRKRYFDINDNLYTVKNALRDIIIVQKRDLVLTEPLKLIDLILCRNVIIYFSKTLQARVMEKFHRALNPGGLLMLGKTESYGSYMEKYFKIYQSGERIYQRR